MRVPFKGRPFLALLLLLALPGCNGDGLCQVTGKVTLDGKPFEGGMVLFEPTGPGRPATGTIEPEGTFKLSTDGVAGANPGEYAVGVVPTGLIGSEWAPPPGPSAAIPRRYHSPTTSDLIFTVKPSGENHFEIPLEPK